MWELSTAVETFFKGIGQEYIAHEFEGNKEIQQPSDQIFYDSFHD